MAATDHARSWVRGDTAPTNPAVIRLALIALGARPTPCVVTKQGATFMLTGLQPPYRPEWWGVLRRECR